MLQFILIESLFYGTFGPIRALVAILELIEYIEPLSFFWQVESSPNIDQKKVIVYIAAPLAIYILNIFGLDCHSESRQRRCGQGRTG